MELLLTFDLIMMHQKINFEFHIHFFPQEEGWGGGMHNKLKGPVHFGLKRNINVEFTPKLSIANLQCSSAVNN